MAHERATASERATLDPFEALAGDVPPRDQRDLMERPFFSLAKAKRVTPILYQAGAIQVQVYAVPEHGMATIWDADVLIWAANQILAAQDRGLPTSRFFRFTPYQLLIAIRRATGNRDHLLKGALTRLQSTVIRTTIRHGEHWRRQQFSWINEWEELATRSGRCEGMEFVLPEWFYQGVLDRRLVLVIDPAYFALSGGIERWLYRVARKHAGRQRDGWRFELRHLHAKSASLARFSDFALDVRRIVARQPLPGYRLALERRNGRELILMRPTLSTDHVDKLCNSSAAIRTSGGTGIGISGAFLSGLRAHRMPPSPSPDDESGAPKDSKSESKFLVVGKPLRAGKPRRPSARRRERTP
jgi:plasmid replication initiation protein